MLLILDYLREVLFVGQLRLGTRVIVILVEFARLDRDQVRLGQIDTFLHLSFFDNSLVLL